MSQGFVPLSQLPADVDPTHPDGLWFCIQRGQVLVGADGAIPTGARAPEVDAASTHVLGVLDGVPVWGVEVAGDGVPDGHELTQLRALYGTLSDQHWTLAGRAEQIVTFDRTHRFCGQCGTETTSNPTDRARVCPSCGHMAFPRLTPAVIMLVEKGDEVLLAHGRQFPGRFFSALAGFVEPGETLEQAVVREVKEETDIDVADVRYFGSQPWPFPHSVMIGFTAAYAGGEITIQEDEIVEAGWYRADDLPPCPIGGMSIAGWLIQDWMTRVESGEVRAAEAPVEPEEPEEPEAPKASIWDRTSRAT